MSGFAILRTKKLKTIKQISGSARHTYRDVPPLNADPTRTPLNQYDRARSAKQLVEAVSARLPDSRRKDAVLAIEYLVGASPEWLVGRDVKARNKYFDDALRWIAQRHGASNVVGWAVHRDEGTPHLVCYVVPLDPQSGRLNASRWLDGRQRLSQMQTEFAHAVGGPHGLERGIEGSRASHLKVQQWYSQITRPDPVLNFAPEEVQLRPGETHSMLADRLSARVMADLKPTFSAAKVVKSVTRRAKELVTTAKVQQRKYDQLARLCAPLIKLYGINERAFDELMKRLRQMVQRFEERNRLEHTRNQPSAGTTSKALEQEAVSDNSAQGVATPGPLDECQLSTSDDLQSDTGWSVELGA
jgi:Plasmid recombination enzyme